MTAAEKISWLCRERGLTQKRVGELACLPENRISKWLDRQGEPTARQALRLARVLGVPADWLADDAQDVPPPAAADGLDDDARLVLRVYRALGLTADEAVRRLSGEAAVPADAYPLDAAGGPDVPGRPGRRRA